MKRWLLVCAVFVCCADLPARADPGLYLANIPVSGVLDTLTESANLTVELVSNHTEQLELALKATTIEVLGSSEDRIRVQLHGEDIVEGQPAPRLFASTWVVDFVEAPVQALVEKLPATQADGAVISPLEVSQFTFDRIATKNTRNGFNIASQVARSLEGDCSEHAVLNAALMRAVGHSARVTLGVLLVVKDQQVQAYGHAWNEVYLDGAWQIHDATMPLAGSQVDRIYYVPLSEMENEGPGYALGMLDFAILRPLAVRLVSGPPR